MAQIDYPTDGMNLAKLFPIIFALPVLTVSPHLDWFFQMEGILLALTVIGLVIVDNLDDGSLWHRIATCSAVIIIIGIVLIVITVAFPLQGKWAIMLHWNSIILTLAVLTIIGVNYLVPDDDGSKGAWIFALAMAADVVVIFIIWLLNFK